MRLDDLVMLDQPEREFVTTIKTIRMLTLRDNLTGSILGVFPNNH